MGICLSTPQPGGQVASQEAGQQAISEGYDVRINDKAGKAAIARTSSGRVVVQVESEETQVDPNAVAIQEGSPEHHALQVLGRMGLEELSSESEPFIAQLLLTVVEVTGLSTTVWRPYVVVTGADDKTTDKPGTPAGDGTLTFDGAKFVFFVLFSNTTLEIQVKGRSGPTSYIVGKASLAVSQLQQGAQQLELDLVGKAGKLGTVKVEVDYSWLRGTRDGGSYTQVQRLVLGKMRGMRKSLRLGLVALEYISQVNHSLLSHDSVWAVQRKGNKEAAPVAAVPDKPSVPLSAEQEQEWKEDEAALQALAKESALMLPEANAASQLTCTLRSAVERETSATSRMAQAVLLEALSQKEGDSPEVAQLKVGMMAVMCPVLERLEQLEAKQAALTSAALQAAQQRQPEQPQLALAGTVAEEAGPSSKQAVEITPFVSGHFEYGLGRPASRRTVFLLMRKAALAGTLHMPRQFLGTHRTKWNGDLGPIPMPATICKTPGHYEMVGLLPDDSTTSKGSLFILEPGTKAVVFDMDGTLTVGDSQVVTQFGLDALGASTALNSQLSHKYDLKQRRNALQLVRAWAAKGYQPIYLSGRQGSYYNLTLVWLIRHRYPPGPIHLTRSHFPTLPVYSSVGTFKVKYMESLKEKGIEIYAAYGNTPTDIKAYDAVGIPKERTFIVGPHGGKANTVRVENLTNHLQEVLTHPDSSVPIPYTELLWSERPGYYRRKKVKGPDGTVRQVSTVSSLAVSGSETSVADSLVEDPATAGHLHGDLKFEDTDDEVSAVGGEH